MTTTESKPVYFMVHTRSGAKVHLAGTGSSVTCCGHWMKVHAKHMRLCDLTDENVIKHKQYLCSKCFPGEFVANCENPSGN